LRRPDLSGDRIVDSWKNNFLDKLREAQSQCAKQFETTLDSFIAPVFDDISGFLRDNGFQVSNPLNENGRRSFKAELAENAYVLMIFRFAGVGEFELRTEIFAPGVDPTLERETGRLADIDSEWAEKTFQNSLDRFVDLLSGQKAEEPKEEMALA
jgi:hypothetical protein